MEGIVCKVVNKPNLERKVRLRLEKTTLYEYLLVPDMALGNKVQM